MIKIARKEVENYKHFSHNLFWSPNDSLYKICSFSNNLPKRIEFLKYVSSLETIKGLVLPTCIII